jgi:hypothetical protein
MFSLISLDKFTHKILFQGPMSYSCLCTLRNKIVSNQFYLIGVTFNGFCLLKRCGRETNDIMTQHIKEMNIKIFLSCNLKFSRDGNILNAISTISMKCNLSTCVKINTR